MSTLTKIFIKSRVQMELVRLWFLHKPALREWCWFLGLWLSGFLAMAAIATFLKAFIRALQ